MTSASDGRPASPPVTVIGAGPYGLSIAAHLAAAGVEHRVFGHPMSAWAKNMPAGMHLKSTPEASSLSAPGPGGTFHDFCRSIGAAEPHEERPIPVEQFVAYGRWFQQRFVPQLERTLVALVRRSVESFDVKLDSGEAFRSRAVVVAAGFEPFVNVPDALAPLITDEDADAPAEVPPLVSHSAQHARLDGFGGRDVAVIGGGQAALESATLLHEGGAHVQVIARSPHIRWGGPPSLQSGGARRIVKPTSGLGEGWSNWVVSNKPQLIGHLPPAARLRVLASVLGPSGAWWLRPRFADGIAVSTGTVVRSAEIADGGRVRLTLAPSRSGDATAAPRRLDVDHVIACTGYRPALDAYQFLTPELVDAVQTVDGWPRLDGCLQSSVPGLHFAGLAAAGTFGPVMRFVYGSDFAARRISAAVAGAR